MNFNYYSEPTPDVMSALSAPAKMRIRERLIMYALVAGLEPERVLEIGTDLGGTAQIILEAMNYTGRGKLVCVDPSPRWNENMAQYERAVLITGRSPDALPECFEAAGGLFNIALIDGDHEFEAVTADLRGVFPYMAEGGCILLHDYLYEPVMRAIQGFLLENNKAADCGALTTRPIDFNGTTQGGLYLLRAGGM